MNITETATLAAKPDRVFEYVDDLAAYPQWLRLVNSVEPASPGPDGLPAWRVELRAKIGPFARSKRLRMVRTECEPSSKVTFERRETDGKDHAMWALQAELAPAPPDSTVLTMHLNYDGDVWAGGGLIGAVLNDEIRRGRRRLDDLLR